MADGRWQQDNDAMAAGVVLWYRSGLPLTDSLLDGQVAGLYDAPLETAQSAYCRP